MAEINVEFLQNLLRKSAGELSEALKNDKGEPKSIEEALNWLNDSLKVVVTEKIQTAKSDGKDEGYGRAKREVLTETEKALATKYDIDLSEVGSGGIEALVESAIAKNNGRSDLDPETVRQTEVYKNDLKSIQQKYAGIKDEFDNYKTEIQQDQVKRVVEEKALSALDKNKFALPDDENIAGNWKKAYVNELMSKYKWDVDADGNPIPKDKDGNPVRDDLHNSLDIEALSVKVAGQYFPKAKGDGRQSPGGGTQPPGSGGGSGKFNLPPIKSHDDFYDKFDKIKDAEERTAFKEQYKTMVEAGELPE